MSVDHVPCLKAWAESLEGITYPLLSDFWPHGEVATTWGVFRREEGTSERAVFLVDREGIVRYSDVHAIDDQPDNEVLFDLLGELEPELAALPATQPEPSEQTAETDTAPAESSPAASTSGAGSAVVMYCTPWCPDCRSARAWLKQHGISFTEVDVSSDNTARERAAALNDGRLHTPTFEIGEDICVDFRADRLTELLGIDGG